MKIKISVTQEDIDNGWRRSCNCCPIALATRRVSGWKAPCVGNSLLWDDGDPHSYMLELPMVALDFINRYDVGDAVTPFEFEIDQ